ncbi:hypothetical protein PHET_00762 [Paragonimus heterotremus]|uniref:guanylate cyclase n=1 Tax=Paragonimus heterotremus TaxID=100268 RepID=A0A8J4ST95_9TREM|nr:hypothetical protein PHET_00762 [Paragonimus heterotremus]
MYGVLIIGVQHFIEEYYGSEIWPVVVERSGLSTLTYQTQKVYSETVIERLIEALGDVTGRTVAELRYQNGLYFAAFTTQHGYDKLLRVQGRSFIHFLRNLDNLHEHLRFSYPKIRPPSFFILSDSPDLIKLVYSSKRLGYEHYVRGQLVTLAKSFYNLNITVTLVSREDEGSVHHITYDITHDGRSWGSADDGYVQKVLPDWEVNLKYCDFLNLLSFFIIITTDMRIHKVSNQFKRFDCTLEGCEFSDKFLIARPYIQPTFSEMSNLVYGSCKTRLNCTQVKQITRESMYGVLIEGLKQYVTKVFGDGLWWVALQHVTGKQKIIQTRQIYPETLLPQMIVQLADMTGVTEDELYYEYGYFFLQYLTDSGFESLLRVLGDGFTEFLNALDDLHHHLQFSYPRIKPPAFLIAHMTDSTIDLVYESRRGCFGHFVRGQLIAIAGLLYELDIDVELLRCVKKTSTHQFTYRIRNKNGKWPAKKSNLQKAEVMSAIPPESSVHGDSYFSLFPFHLVFTDTLKISSAGAGFRQFVPGLIGQLLSDVLFIVRPKIEITFTRIKLHHHNTFELVLVKDCKLQTGRGMSLSQAACKFKGQMCFVEEWNMMLFLGTPVLRDTKQLAECGLFISDLNMFDRSRDIILSGDQQSEELMKLFKKVSSASNGLCTRFVSFNSTFDSVSICFTKVVNFGAKCMRINVEQIIGLLNNMYTLFDALTESHKVYKVETIGDSYMLVSGAPHHTPLHAAHITEMALSILESTQKRLQWPEASDGTSISSKTKQGLSTPLEPVQLFIGCHTGPIVAGVVGYKTPRYCLFGDTVNTASRMMSNSLGKGEMETFFIEGRDLQFTFFDNNLRSRRNFMEILKEDFEQNDDIPSEECLSSDSVSFELSEDISEEMDGDLQLAQSKTLKVEATESKTGTLTNRKPRQPSLGKKEGSESTKNLEAPPVKAQDSKQVGKTTESNNTSKLNTQSTSDVRTRKMGIAAPTAVKEQSKKEDQSQNQESATTRVLNEAARRLVVSKANNARQKESKRQPDVTFASGAPSEILNEPFDAEMIIEDGDEPVGSTRRTSSPLKIRIVSGNNTDKVTGPVPKTDVNTQQTANSLLSSGSIKQNSNGAVVATQGRSIQRTGRCKEAYACLYVSEDQRQFMDMVERKMFEQLPILPLRSPNSAILREIGELCIFSQRYARAICKFETICLLTKF